MTAASSANARFLLRTLGVAQLDSLEAGSNGAPLLGAGKPYALLVYLALAPQRTASRESLIDLLWANAEPDRARQTLRQTLSQLRQLLGEQGLMGGTRDVTIGGAVRMDLDDFFAAMRLGRYREAIDQCAGPFLPDFAIPGGEAFDRWAAAQRERVRGAHHFALDSIVRSHLEAGHPREAEPLARALRDGDPFDQSAWRMLIESLLSAGNALEAKLEADSFERFLAAAGREPEPSARDVALRARQMVPPAAAEGERLAIDLIGREREFSALVSAWERTLSGHAQVVDVVAPAGLGKTRLLEDLHHRLRARGPNALFTRAVWGERTFPFALAAALARALAPLRGAAGVSPHTARTLVGLDPAMSSYFNVAPAVPESSAEGTRLVAAALLELLRAVSEERPVALLIDDLHWADNHSLAALSAMLDRLDAEKVLIVAARRPPGAEGFGGIDPTRMELAALTRSQMNDLIMSMAAPGDVAWESELLDALEASTGGSPLLILETLRSTRDSNLLAIEDGVWYARDHARLLQELGKGKAIARRIQQQPPVSRRVLLLCALAGESIAEDALRDAHGGTADDLRTAFDELERRGLIVRRPPQIQMAHDQLGEIMLAGAAPEEIRAAQKALGRALAAIRAPGTVVMQQAARHLVEGGAGAELGDLYLAWRRSARERGDHRTDRRLASALLGDLANDERMRIALAARPMMSRIAGSGPRSAGMLAGALVFAGVLAYLAFSPRPYRLAMGVTPLSASDALGMVPVPVVEIHDQYGRPLNGYGDTVRLTSTTPGVSLRGDTAVAATNGRASFGNVFLAHDQIGAIALRFAAPQVAPLLIILRGADQPTMSLHLVQATLNGATLSPASRRLAVSPGDSIVGSVLLRYDTDWPAASVILTAVPTWGDRRTNFVNLGPLVTPGRDLRRTAGIRLRAPRRPGCYRVILAFQAEDDVRYIASGTNWQVGAPIWGDGNDIMDWSAADLHSADSAGVVQSTIVRVTAGRRVRDPNLVPATTVSIDVRDPKDPRRALCERQPRSS